MPKEFTPEEITEVIQNQRLLVKMIKQLIYDIHSVSEIIELKTNELLEMIKVIGD